MTGARVLTVTASGGWGWGRSPCAFGVRKYLPDKEQRKDLLSKESKLLHGISPCINLQTWRFLTLRAHAPTF